MLSQFLKAGLR